MSFELYFMHLLYKIKIRKGHVHRQKNFLASNHSCKGHQIKIRKGYYSGILTLAKGRKQCKQ